MTEERLIKNRQNGEKLNDIIIWSLQNRWDWFELCFGDADNGIKTHHLNFLIDQCLYYGYMEIYCVILTILAGTAGICTEEEKLLLFFEASVDKNLALDMEKNKRGNSRSSLILQAFRLL